MKKLLFVAAVMLAPFLPQSTNAQQIDCESTEYTPDQVVKFILEGKCAGGQAEKVDCGDPQNVGNDACKPEAGPPAQTVDNTIDLRPCLPVAAEASRDKLDSPALDIFSVGIADLKSPACDGIREDGRKNVSIESMRKALTGIKTSAGHASQAIESARAVLRQEFSECSGGSVDEDRLEDLQTQISALEKLDTQSIDGRKNQLQQCLSSYQLYASCAAHATVMTSKLSKVFHKIFREVTDLLDEFDEVDPLESFQEDTRNDLISRLKVRHDAINALCG